MQFKEIILILDFGSQYTQLITRRIRECGVYSEIHSFNISIDKIKEMNPSGIIFSGGPSSVYDEGAPHISREIYSLGIPILGLCYGLQLICLQLGGSVEPAGQREYGKAKFRKIKNSALLKDIKEESVVWMSHGDYLTAMPKGFEIIGDSENSPCAPYKILRKKSMDCSSILRCTILRKAKRF